MNEFISKDGKIIVNVDHADAYIPESLFKNEESMSAVASSYGEGFKVLGVFNMHLSNNPDEDLLKTPLRTFNYPNMIETYPSGFSKATLSLTNAEEETEYRVLHYKQGDIVMDALMQKDDDNALRFLKVVCAGKLPTSLSYNDVIVTWHKNLSSNGTVPNIPSMYLQAIIAEMYRWRKDPTKPFRKVYGNDMSSNDYIVTDMRTTTAYTSVFTSQVFEDMGRMLATSINTSRRDLPQSISPIEKTLYM